MHNDLPVTSLVLKALLKTYLHYILDSFQGTYGLLLVTVLLQTQVLVMNKANIWQIP